MTHSWIERIPHAQAIPVLWSKQTAFTVKQGILFYKPWHRMHLSEKNGILKL